MVIELRGVEFVNKGAELMLHAIMAEVKREIKDPVFVMEKGSRTPVEKLKENDIYIKPGKRKSLVVRYIPKPIRRKLGYILEPEVETVIDGSGFAFGDQWGAAYAERRLGLKIEKWHREGKKVILLPQAFGPFTDPCLKKVMEKILIHSSLVFAREKQSFEYLTQVSPKRNFEQAPDFTNLISGKIPNNFDTERHQVALIPNFKMIAKQGNDDTQYIKFLILSIKKIIGCGLRPYFLIHEGKQDIEIAEKVNSMLDKPISIIVHQDPLFIKGIISTARFIICSRFHGVVSALSQGIPCIVTSWSHKYEMLLKEYDFENGLLTSLDNKTEIESKIEELSTPAINKQISENLLVNSQRQKDRSKEMWKTVFTTIKM